MWKTIFSSLDKNKTPTREEINKIPSFLFLRWLQNSPVTIMAANRMNLYYKIPVENQYNAVKQGFAGRGLRIPYLKSTKDTSKEDEILARHFQINLDKAHEYRDFLTNSEISEIVEMYNKIKG